VGDDAQPETRRLLRVEIADQLVTDRVINELMGKDASARSASSWNEPRTRRNSTV
jgi:DNA gyrase/topoisomerase IV subunit B